ncbi:hypothetical protein M0R45_037607 [Rubus argutus]|uniref:Uncharacterized protein n=1 Tax=Rubus argutus TaxID=59490 RepID=A0AAW1W2E6_RUBAR
MRGRGGLVLKALERGWLWGFCESDKAREEEQNLGIGREKNCHVGSRRSSAYKGLTASFFFAFLLSELFNNGNGRVGLKSLEFGSFVIAQMAPSNGYLSLRVPHPSIVSLPARQWYRIDQQGTFRMVFD